MLIIMSNAVGKKECQIFHFHISHIFFQSRNKYEQVLSTGNFNGRHRGKGGAPLQSIFEPRSAG